MADFAAELAKLGELDDTALAALEQGILDIFDEADSGENADPAALEEIAKALEQVQAERAKRSGSAPTEAPAEAAAAAPAPALAADGAETTPAAPVDTPAEAPAEDPAAPSTEESAATTPQTLNDDDQKEGVTAVAASGTVAVPRDAEPLVASASTSVVIAGNDIPGYTPGQVFKDGDEFGQALSARINSVMRMTGGDGEQVMVASIRAEAPEERILSFGDMKETKAKIDAVVSPAAITAAGGCCAPLTTRYDLFDCGGITDRPVRDSLPSFRADRGGIRWFSGPSLGDMTGGIGFWTCADDAKIHTQDVGTGTGTDVAANWKKCTTIQCPPENTAEIQAITLCVTFGVLMSRIFPEVATANNKLLMVAHARIAESALLAQIKAGSKKLTGAAAAPTAGIGAVRELLDEVSRAVAYYRDKYRLGKGTFMRAIIPVWALDALRSDISMGPDYGGTGDFGVSDSTIEGWFRDRHINITWALDGDDPATNNGGLFTALPTAAAATPIPAWPNKVEWALFTEGSWLLLDGGSLDLGVIRDSSLVRTNSYRQFSESFESVVHIGCESWWIESTIAINGKNACCA